AQSSDALAPVVPLEAPGEAPGEATEPTATPSPDTTTAPESTTVVESEAESSDGRLYSHHTTGAQEHLYNEPQGAFCVREDKTRIVVHSATQWPFLLRDTVCSVLNISARNCVIRTADIGTSLDGKLWYPALTAAHAALGCFLTGKPLKIMYSREEDFRFSTKRAPAHIRYATSVDENGEIESMDITVHLAVGAYGVFTHEMLSRTALAATGHYRRKNLRITARAVRTNLPPANVFSGFGDGAGSFALESHISRVVAATEFVPSSWKAANLLTRGEHDITGILLDNDADAGALIEKVAANSDFNRKHAAFELQKKRRGAREEIGIRPRGIGIAFASSIDGFLDHGQTSSLSSTVKVRLDSESKATIFTSAVAENQSLHQHWIQLVSDILGISDVEIVDIDTDMVPDSGPSTLSRNTAVIGKLIETCANTIKKRRFRDPLPLEARKTVKAAKGKKAEQDWSKVLSAQGTATAACVVEVELERATLATRIRGIWMCVEAGRILDLEQARKKLEAGVAQALGWTTGEVIEYVEGAITADCYALYKPGRAPTRDQLHIEFINLPGKRSLHGIESLAGLVVPAAYIAATEQAGAVQLNAIPGGPSAIIGSLEAT
ncbi:MAG: molybdopterin-dependent oxidoreductase, partial [Spirochaeta sp.]|nr:molybdopterin-dependent oxidoreductase [Spirochaeta sp.]